jgi:hypothetical protein
VTAVTSEGRRVIDILAESPAGKLINVEVKTGSAVRTAAQVANDEAMASEGALLVGKSAPIILQGGKPIRATDDLPPDVPSL